MDSKIKAKWVAFQEEQQNLTLKFSGPLDPDLVDQIKKAVILWRFVKHIVNRQFSSQIKVDFLQSFLENENQLIVLVAKLEMLPDFIYRKILWRENIDYMDFESCLRRLTYNPDKMQSIHKNYQVLCVDKKVPPVLSSFTNSIIDAILVLVGFYTYNKISTMSIMNENGKRYEAKGELLYNLGYLDFGFAKYHKGPYSDEYLTNKSPLDFFLNKEKTDGTETNFYVNTDDGMYYRFFVFTRSWLTFKPIFDKEHSVTLPRAICPGFWVTIFIGITFLVNPMIGLVAAPSNVVAYMILWLFFLLVTMIFITRVLFKKEQLTDTEKIVVWGVLYPVSFIGLFFAYPYASKIVFIVAAMPLVIWLVAAFLIMLGVGCVRLYQRQSKTLKSIVNFLISAIVFSIAAGVCYALVSIYWHYYQTIFGLLPQLQFHILVIGLMMSIYGLIAEFIKEFDEHANKIQWTAYSFFGTIGLELMLYIVRYFSKITEYIISSVKWIGTGVAEVATSTVDPSSANSLDTTMQVPWISIIVGLIIVASYFMSFAVIIYYYGSSLNELQMYHKRKVILLISVLSNSMLVWHLTNIYQSDTYNIFMLMATMTLIIASMLIVKRLFKYNEDAIRGRMNIRLWEARSKYSSSGRLAKIDIVNSSNKTLLSLDNFDLKNKLDQIHSALMSCYLYEYETLSTAMKLVTKNYSDVLYDKLLKVQSSRQLSSIYYEDVKLTFIKLLVDGAEINDAYEQAKQIEDQKNQKLAQKCEREKSDKVSFISRIKNWIVAHPMIMNAGFRLVSLLQSGKNSLVRFTKLIWNDIVIILKILVKPFKKMYLFVLSGALMAEKMSKECPMTPAPTDAE